VLATLAIVMGGSHAQQERWLPQLAAGTKRATVAIAEPGDRWLRDQWQIDGGGALRGEKHCVLHARDADLMVVGIRGGLTLVERDAAGVELVAMDGVDRTRRFATVRLDGVQHEPLPNGGEAAHNMCDAGLVLLAADAYGGASRCEEMTVDYAKVREQFGVPLAHFQAVRHQLADLALQLEPARYLYWYAAHAFDHVPADATRFAALAKAHLTDCFVDVGRRSIELHGGVGYTWAHDIHFFLKRAVFDRAYLGSPAAHRARIADLNGW